MTLNSLSRRSFRSVRWPLILCAVFVSVAYLLFFAATFFPWLVIHPASPFYLTVGGLDLWKTDFSRFWFVGRSFDISTSVLPKPPESGFTADILSPSAGDLIWLYPPTMNLIAMPFGRLSLGLGFLAWRLSCWAIAAFLLRFARLPWIVVLAGLLSPAGLCDVFGGQNGTLCGALLVSALLLGDRRPRSAGALAGILCIKPQTAIILPLILLQKRPAAFRSCMVVAIILVALSLLVEGAQPWIWFMTVAQPTARRILQTPLAKRFFACGSTVFWMARSLRASLACAFAVQAIASACAAILIWRLWRRRIENPIPTMAATICLAALVSPYGFLYDETGFAIAMAAMAYTAPSAFKPIFAALWLASGYMFTVANVTGFLLFPLAAIIGAALSWCLIAETGSQASMTATAF